MNINFSYHNADEACKKELENYADEVKLRSLTRLLQHGNYDLADLDVRVEYQSHHDNYLLKMDLKIKKHVLFAEVAGYGITGAFDVALEKIVVQLRKIESIKHSKVLHKIRHNRL